MNSLEIEAFNYDTIRADFEYAKGFKSPYVLFTSNGQCIGIGDNESYIKTEIGINKECSFRNIILETKTFNKALKEIDAAILQSLYSVKDFPLKIKFPSGLEILKGLSPMYTEMNITSMILECESFTQVYKDSLNKDSEWYNDYKNLHADEGTINLIVKDKYLVPIHKRILNITSTDKVDIEVLDREGCPYFYMRIYISSGKKGFTYCTYLKGLKV